jgi:hypothetical protein
VRLVSTDEYLTAGPLKKPQSGCISQCARIAKSTCDNCEHSRRPSVIHPTMFLYPTFNAPSPIFFSNSQRIRASFQKCVITAPGPSLTFETGHLAGRVFHEATEEA